MKEPKVFSKLKSKKIINDKGKEVEIDVDRVKRLARWGFPYWPLEWRKKFEDKPIRQIYTEIEQSKRIFSEMDSFVSKQRNLSASLTSCRLHNYF